MLADVRLVFTPLGKFLVGGWGLLCIFAPFSVLVEEGLLPALYAGLALFLSWLFVAWMVKDVLQMTELVPSEPRTVPVAPAMPDATQSSVRPRSPGASPAVAPAGLKAATSGPPVADPLDEVGPAVFGAAAVILALRDGDDVDPEGDDRGEDEEEQDEFLGAGHRDDLDEDDPHHEDSEGHEPYEEDFDGDGW